LILVLSTTGEEEEEVKRRKKEKKKKKKSKHKKGERCVKKSGTEKAKSFTNTTLRLVESKAQIC